MLDLSRPVSFDGSFMLWIDVEFLVESISHEKVMILFVKFLFLSIYFKMKKRWTLVVANPEFYLKALPESPELEFHGPSGFPSPHPLPPCFQPQVTYLHVPWVIFSREENLERTYWCPRLSSGYIVKYVSYYLLMSVLIKQWELNGCFLIKTMIS